MNKTKKKRKIIIILLLLIVVSTVIGYNILNKVNNNTSVAIMLEDGDSWVQAPNSSFTQEGYDFDHANCLNGSTVTNGENGISIRLTKSDKCILYYVEKRNISFTVDGTTYQAKAKMTWQQWLNSEYNVDDYVAYNTLVAKTETTANAVFPVVEQLSPFYAPRLNDVIIEDNAYLLDPTDNPNKRNATATTAAGNYRDYGVQLESGSEYFSGLQTITTSESNSTIIGNQNDNIITVIGGTDNVLTGLLGDDTYIFESGGGTITDFGMRALVDISGKNYAINTTTTESTNSYAYDRTNPLTYKEGTDILKVNGTITLISYPGYGSSTTQNSQTMTVTIYYTDTEGDMYNIILDNIVKNRKSTKYYNTDDNSITSLNLYDTSTGSMVALSTSAIRALIQ